MGLETFRSERKQKANRLFLLTCGTLAVWSFLVSGVMLSETAEQALRYRRYAVFFWSITYSIYLHFIIVLTGSGEHSKTKRKPIRAVFKMLLLYIPGLFSIYLYYFHTPSTIEEMVRISYGWAYLNLPRNFIWDNYFLILYLTYIIASIFALYLWQKRSTLHRMKKMARIIIFSTIAALLVGTITDFLLPLTSENPFPPLGVLVSLIPIIGVRSATSRYRLLQLNPFGTVKDILQNMKEGLLLVNLNSVVVEVNREANTLLGYEAGELVGVQLSDLLKEVDTMQKEGTEGTEEFELVTKSGRYLPVMLTSETLRDEWGDPLGTLVLFRDITEFKNIHAQLRKSHTLLERRVLERTSKLTAINQNLENEIVKRIQMEEKLRSISYRDQLTGLANRRLFTEWLEKAIFEADDTVDRLAVYSINLDAFKMVNDTFGHLQGDAILKSLAERMRQILGSYANIARSEGDNFLILSRYKNDSESLFTDVDLIRSIFKDPFTLGGREIFISSTMGISTFPEDSRSADSLIKNAEIAMAEAIETGHDQYEFFKPELKSSINNEMQLSNDLYQAVERGEFELYYQPQINPHSGVIEGMESLIRWNHPTRGLVPPGMFIEIAERNTLILKVGEWVLRSACSQLKKWRDLGYTDLVLAVNVSIKQLLSGKLSETIHQVLEEEGVPPSALEIELTESVLITRTSSAIEEIARVRALGVKVAIDDFGTVYSSLNYLKMLPLDRMKIAREFVVGIGNSDVDEAIIAAMIVLGRSMNLEIIGEGVETLEQLEFLKARSCDLIQGYYYSKPIPVDIMTTLLNSQSHLG